MRRIILLLLMLCSVSLAARLSDPFDKKRRIKPAVPPNEDNAPSVCVTERDTVVAEQYAFAELQVIGLLEYADSHKVIFSAPDTRVFILHPNELIARERLRLKRINRNSIQFLRPRSGQDCTIMENLNLHF
ncbi:hypothetical protein EDC45_1190 [Mesocricetibacter intestinalis]|uniref:Pilus assembly protein PilP n=1 Tax=Mesocricetibacter intestinalis TaxID=1521930 RepID=A0A4V3D9Q1_9PAST|nr:hypothetical protein [Mesocricetibacter intestinalis]TDQ58117.1 hypothetical protein EDC45_1190 [Mesocricetibacter intestinalis]